MSVSSLDRLLGKLRPRSSHRQNSKKSPPSLSTLLNERNFDSICDVLLNDPSVNTHQWFEGEYSTIGENCLHATMKARPPPTLVKLMLNRLIEYGISEPELSVDELGRTPLHHAVGYSCGPAVVELLVRSSAGQTSVLAQDVEGRLPLHLAMRPYLLYTGADHKIHPTCSANLQLSEARKIMRATIAILTDVCPQSVMVLDDMGKTPIQYAEHLKLDKNFSHCARFILDEMRMAAAHETRKVTNGNNKDEGILLSTGPSYTKKDHSGMVIEISSVTSETDDDDLSVLSWE